MMECLISLSCIFPLLSKFRFVSSWSLFAFVRAMQLKLSYAVPKRSEGELSKSRKLYVSKLGDVTKGASHVILYLHSLVSFSLFLLSMCG